MVKLFIKRSLEGTFALELVGLALALCVKLALPHVREPPRSRRLYKSGLGMRCRKQWTLGTTRHFDDFSLLAPPSAEIGRGGGVDLNKQLCVCFCFARRTLCGLSGVMLGMFALSWAGERERERGEKKTETDEQQEKEKENQKQKEK